MLSSVWFLHRSLQDERVLTTLGVLMGIDLDIKNADEAPSSTQNNKPPPKQNGASGDSKHDLPKKAKTESSETPGQSEVLVNIY